MDCARTGGALARIGVEVGSLDPLLSLCVRRVTWDDAVRLAALVDAEDSIGEACDVISAAFDAELASTVELTLDRTGFSMTISVDIVGGHLVDG